jgi:hypothetical protein
LWRGGRRNWPHPRSPGGRVFRFFVRFGSGFGLGFGFGLSQQILADFFCDVYRNRARVRLLFRDAVPWQEVNNGLGLDLQFAGQLVNSDLVCVSHASF